MRILNTAVRIAAVFFALAMLIGYVYYRSPAIFGARTSTAEHSAIDTVESTAAAAAVPLVAIDSPRLSDAKVEDQGTSAEAPFPNFVPKNAIPSSQNNLAFAAGGLQQSIHKKQTAAKPPAPVQKAAPKTSEPPVFHGSKAPILLPNSVDNAPSAPEQPAPRQRDFTIESRGPAELAAGENDLFTMIVRNTGTQELKDMAVVSRCDAVGFACMLPPR
jgi:hypothetical protein